MQQCQQAKLLPEKSGHFQSSKWYICSKFCKFFGSRCTDLLKSCCSGILFNFVPIGFFLMTWANQIGFLYDTRILRCALASCVVGRCTQRIEHQMSTIEYRLCRLCSGRRQLTWTTKSPIAPNDVKTLVKVYVF